MFFTVKYIYLTLYIVHTYRVAPIYTVPACSHARARVAVPAPVPAPVCARPRPCLRACVRPCVRAGTCVRGRARGRASVSFQSPIMYILRRYARPARRVVRSAHSAVNFFEIVFKPSISIPPSLAWVDGTT